MQIRRLSSYLLVLFLTLITAPAQQPGGTPTPAEQSQPPQQSAPQQQRRRFQLPPPKNLKVLPKDISSEELIDTMKKFAGSLGVRCNYCHVGEEGKPLNTYDFASDEKPAKQNARLMMEMVRQINTTTLPKLKMDDKAEPVTCYTCHRGKVQPETQMPEPKRPEAPKPGL
jgi:hypothetical protein